MKRYLFLILAAIFCMPSEGFAQESGPDWGRDPWHKLSNVTPESTWKAMMPSLSDHFKKDFPSKSKTATTPRKALLYAVENTTDEVTGQTTVRWSDGSSYIGITNSGAMLVGTMTYADGSKYVGPWVRNMPNGKGTFQTPEGIMYTVNFENGIPHGKGIIQDLDGRLYSARWVRGKLKEKSIKPLEEK